MLGDNKRMRWVCYVCYRLGRVCHLFFDFRTFQVMPRYYRATDLDPKYICTQIVAIQSFYYLVFGLLLLIFHGTNLSLDQFFAYKLHTFENVEGIKNSVAVLVTAVASALSFYFILERAKQCLDFAATLYLIDLALCIAYQGFPMAWEWWLVHILSAIVTVLLGEYVCSRRELQDIPILSSFSRRSSPSTLPQ